METTGIGKMKLGWISILKSRLDALELIERIARAYATTHSEWTLHRANCHCELCQLVRVLKALDRMEGEGEEEDQTWLKS